MKVLVTVLLSTLMLTVTYPVVAAEDFIVVEREQIAATGGETSTTASVTEAEEEEGWTWERLSYGPIELCAAGLMPVIGIFAGGTIGAVIPMKGMHPYCKVLVPYMAIGGAAVGATAGAILAPVVVMEGVFDTLTGGAFASRPFAWFNVKVPLDGGLDLSTIENAAFQQAVGDTENSGE